MRKLITALCSFALMFVLTLMGRTEVMADGGSYLPIWLTHDYSACEGCSGVDMGQKVLTGSTHTFTLCNVPDEVKDCNVTWKLEGADKDVAEIVQSTDTYVKVKFNSAGNWSLGVCIDAEIDVSEVYPGESVYADYWVGVYDQFYNAETKYAALNVGETKALTCDTVLFDAEHPTGGVVTLTDGTWSAVPRPLNKNTSGLTISDSGVISAAASGSYIVWGYDKDGNTVCTYWILVPSGSLAVGDEVTVKSSEEAIYSFCPTVTGEYIFISDMLDLYDDSGVLQGEYSNGAYRYSLTAGNMYYIVIYNGSDRDVTTKIQGPTEDTQTPSNPSGGTGTTDTQISSDVPEKGTSLTCGKVTYKVTAEGSEVAYTKTSAAAKTIKIPATVTINDNTYKVTSIAASAFKGNTKMTKVTIGKNVTSIGANAFSGCTKLKTVSIGAGVASIGKAAFKGCTALTAITIPNKVTSIGANAFSGCTKLKTVTIGTGLQTIGKKTFYGCKALKTITIKSKKLTNVGANAFKGIKATAKIKVPSKKLADYTKLLKGKGQGSKAVISKI